MDVVRQDKQEIYVMNDVKKRDLTPEEKAKPYSKDFHGQEQNGLID
jgi:hypothetical protein